MTQAFDVEGLLRHALTLPDASRGISCAGTSLERPTAEVGGKAFIFVGPQDVRLKLRSSLDEARRTPGCVVGANGWVKATPQVPAALVRRWVRESWGLFSVA